MNRQQPKLKHGSCWLPWNHLHTPHPNFTELTVSHYSTRSGIRLPSSASFTGLISHWEAVADRATCFSADVGYREWGCNWAWRRQHLQSFLTPLLPGGPQTQSQQSLACKQTWPTGRGQVMRIRPGVFAYPQHGEGN